MDETSLQEVAALAQRAVVEPACWQDMLDALCAATGASGAALFSLHPAAGGELLVGAARRTRDSLDEYARHWLGRDAWIDAVAARHHFDHAGAIATGRSALPVAELRRTAFHCDFLRRHDVEELMSLKVCDAADAHAPTTLLSLYRPPGGPLFDAAEAGALRALWPSVRGAVQAHYLVARGRQAGALAAQALDALPSPAWVLREDAAIEHANAAACAAMRPPASDGGWLRTAAGRLAAIGDIDAEGLKVALRGARGGRPWVGTAFVARAGLPGCAFLHLSPLDASPSLAAAWPRAVALLVLRPPRDPLDGGRWLSRLQRACGLTPSEARVLERLAAGLAPREIAAELEVSYTTVRTHLRALHAKTGCRRQAELVRLAAAA